MTSFVNIDGLALIHVDAQGVIQGWSKGAETLFGHHADQAIGKRVDLIVPEPYRVMHWEGFNRTIKTNWRGSEAWGALEALNRNGHLVAVEVLLTGLPQAEGGLAGVLALFRHQVAT